jgi:hypothetical protein
MIENRDEVGWKLLEDGALWKKASWHTDANFRERAKAFVVQLQELLMLPAWGIAVTGCQILAENPQYTIRQVRRR